jgi:hypothetical protein
VTYPSPKGLTKIPSRAGISTQVAMQISGHKTESVFQSCSIVDERDMQMAALKQEEYFESLVGTKTGTIRKIPNEKRGNRNG